MPLAAAQHVRQSHAIALDQYRNSLLFASCTTHCSPSCRFVPVIALHALIVQTCVLMASSPSPCTVLSIAIGLTTHRRSRRTAPHRTYLPHLVFRHGPGNVAFVLEHEQARSHEPLPVSAWNVPPTPACRVTHLFLEQALELAPAVVDPLTVRGVDHPDERVRLLKVVLPVRPQRLLPAHIPCDVSVPCPSCCCSLPYICLVCSFVRQLSFLAMSKFLLPIVLDRLDDKSKSRADTVYVLVHDLLHNGSLACIVQTPGSSQQHSFFQTCMCYKSYSIKILISLSFKRAFRKIDSIFALSCSVATNRSTDSMSEVDFSAVG